MNVQLSPESTAVIIVDVQNDFCHEKGAKGLKGADLSRAQAVVPAIEKLTSKARSIGVPVFFVRTTHSNETNSKLWLERPQGKKNVDICQEGTWGAEFYKLEPQGGDIIVEKHNYSAFIKTNLEDMLRAMGRTSLVMGGVATNVCVESTARHGFMIDFHVTLVRDACGGYNAELEEGTFKNIQNNFGQVMDSEQILEAWSEYSSTVHNK